MCSPIITAAELIGVNKGTLENWEGQHRHPALFCMPAIIRFLGCNPLSATDALTGKLTRYRMSLGITQGDMARRLSIDQCTLARWERGDRTPTGLYRKLVEKLLTDDLQDH